MIQDRFTLELSTHALVGSLSHLACFLKEGDARKLERQKYFLMLIIICEILVLLLTSLCSFFILVHQAIINTKMQRSRIPDVGTHPRLKPMYKGKPSQELFLQ